MKRHYHFIGIGGIGVGALAALALDKGWQVSGSDVRGNQVTERLAARGARIYQGHSAEHVHGADCVVFSSAIKDDNPEMAEARARGIPLLRRAQLLAQLMDGFTGITVAGAHGKTTTTSMIAELLTGAGLRPAAAIGGIVNGSGSHAALAEGTFFVAEVDESDGSFLYFSPKYSVITNIDLEHVDFYPDWNSILDAYRRFIDRTAADGLILAYGEDERLRALLSESGRSYQTYGFSKGNDWQAANVSLGRWGSHFEIISSEKGSLGEFELSVPGKHNVLNALACVGVALTLAVDVQTVRDQLKRFTGVQRRFQLKGHVHDIWVIDDYAHHPTEIQNTLQTARAFQHSLPGASRLFAVFQPHRFSRVRGLFEEFAKSLTWADHVIVTDIYAASEQPIPGITAERLCDRVRSLTDKPVVYLPQAKILDYLLNIVRPSDMVLTLGAGDITALSSKLVDALTPHAAVGEAVS